MVDHEPLSLSLCWLKRRGPCEIGPWFDPCILGVVLLWYLLMRWTLYATVACFVCFDDTTPAEFLGRHLRRELGGSPAFLHDTILESAIFSLCICSGVGSFLSRIFDVLARGVGFLDCARR